MSRILDTTPAFEEFARKAFSRGPLIRAMMCEQEYHKAYPEVFDSYFKIFPKDGLSGVLWEISEVRKRVRDGAPALSRIIPETEAKLKELLGAQAVAEPQHVLMVGTLTTNAFVGRLGGDVAVFHCLEWFGKPEPAAVLVAHEATHAWHETILGSAPPEDLAWTAFYEGLAIRASRELVPGMDENDYFWYGVAGFDDWLPWCRSHREKLLARFATSLDEEGAAEAFFGAGFVEDKWRVGFYVASELLGLVEAPLSELVRLPAADAASLIRQTLESAGFKPGPASKVPRPSGRPKAKPKQRSAKAAAKPKAAKA